MWDIQNVKIIFLRFIFNHFNGPAIIIMLNFINVVQNFGRNMMKVSGVCAISLKLKRII